MKTVKYPSEQIRQQLTALTNELARCQPADKYLAECLPVLLAVVRASEQAAISQKLFDEALAGLEGGHEWLPTLKQLPPESRSAIWHTLQQMYLPALSSAGFAELMDFVLEIIDRHPFGPSRKVRELAALLCPVAAGANVLNLEAGTAELAMCLPDTVSYCGEEADALKRSQGRLRLHALGRPTELLLQKVTSDNSGPQHFDVIFSLSSNDAAAVIARAQHLLAPAGKAIIAVSSYGLSDAKQRAVQQGLVESGVLVAVIEFPDPREPENIVLFQFILLVLDNSKPHPDTVIFCSALDYKQYDPWAPEGDQENQRILTALRNPADSAIARLVPVSEIANEGYSLVGALYDRQPVVMSLGELTKVIACPRVTPGSPARPVVAVRRAQAGHPTSALLTVERPESVDPTEPLFRLSEDALVVSLRGPRLRPNVYRPRNYGPQGQLFGEEIWLTSTFLALAVDEHRVTMEYLIQELESDDAVAQLAAGRSDATSPISLADVLRIQILVPSLRTQEARVSARRTAHREEEKRLLDAVRAQRREAFEQLATLRHRLAQPLSGVSASMNNLRDLIERRTTAALPVQLDTLLSARNPVTVGETLNGVTRSVEYIDFLLNRAEAELFVEEYPRENLNLVRFLEQLVTDARGEASCYALSFRKQEFRSAPMVYANENLLKMLFRHILNNAARHGFPNSDDPQNTVWIDVSIFDIEFDDGEANSYLRVMVSNNGRPLPTNFDVQKLARKNVSAGDSGNTGIGGYEVGQIIKYFGGNLRLISSPGEEWTVKYEIELPYESQDTIEMRLAQWRDENLWGDYCNINKALTQPEPPADAGSDAISHIK